MKEQSQEKKRTVIIRTILIVVLILALLASAWCIWYLVQYYKGAQLGAELQTIGFTGENPIDAEPETQESVKIPVDFDALQAINPDVYAWVVIPDTAISYPVVHRAGDNGFYANHSSDGAYYSGGSIYSEDYNGELFADPMTLLYGHNLRNGTMFAQLNDFADASVFEAHQQIYVYLPDRALVYQIFAATPHTNEHLLANYDFSAREDYEGFFSDLLATRSMSANFRETWFPVYGQDRVLTLSTCFRANNQQRFLVMGRLIAEIPAKP